jgi:hypothetical protein
MVPGEVVNLNTISRSIMSNISSTSSKLSLTVITIKVIITRATTVRVLMASTMVIRDTGTVGMVTEPVQIVHEDDCGKFAHETYDTVMRKAQLWLGDVLLWKM